MLISMKKVRRKILALAGAGVLAAGLAAGAATASAEDVAPLNHTHVSVDGDTSVADPPIPTEGDNITDIHFTTDWEVELWCPDSEITGNIFRGEPVAVGNVIGEITEMLFDNCLATPLNFPVIVEMDAGDFEVREHPANAGDPVEVTITGVEAHMHDGGAGFCDLYADGSVDATIYPAGHPDSPDPSRDGVVQLISAEFDSNGNPVAGFDLDITTPTGLPTCGGLIEPGDVAGAWDDPAGVPSIFGLTTQGPDAGPISHQ